MKMPQWTQGQIVELMRECQQLGHELYFEHKPPPPDFPGGIQKFYAGCSCGYKSTMRATNGTAIQTGLHHLMKIALSNDLVQSGERARNGVSVPKIVRPST